MQHAMQLTLNSKSVGTNLLVVNEKQLFKEYSDCNTIQKFLTQFL